MPNPEQTRLTISWSKQADLELRTYLGAQGMKKGDLSRFIEDAVMWRIFDQTTAAIQARNQDAGADELRAVIDQTVREVRQERGTRR